MNNNDEFISTTSDNKIDISDKKRSGILYYSISQVATLLGETESQIRYYTNIFDDLLQIQISNKEFIYTEKDIDTLEFLIKLKNKGLSTKEISAYCNHLPLGDSEIIKESNSTSISDFMNLISQTEDKKYEKLEHEIKAYVDNTKEQLLSELTKHIDLQLQTYFVNIQNDLKITTDKLNNLLTEELSKTNKQYTENFDTLTKLITDTSNKLNNDVLNTVKRYRDIIERATSIQNDILLENSKPRGFFARLLGEK